MRYVHVKLGKYPGQIVSTMVTNVLVFEGWDLMLEAEDLWSMQCGRQGGRFWYLDMETQKPRLRQEVEIEATPNRAAVGESIIVTVEGVPDNEPSVSLMINGKDEVTLNRLPSGVLDHLELTWDAPTPVSITLHPRNVRLRAMQNLVTFEEPEA
jgi:hypothetical protein